MQVLGDLIQLPADLESLPLPWWHRAPLGLKNNTSVEVALLQTATRPLGDLIVSVLKPEKWENILKLECSRHDGPGVIARLLDAVYPLNIALAETATIQPENLHYATLICELRDPGNIQEHFVEIRRRLEHEQFTIVSLEPFQRAPLPLDWQCVATVERGWLHLNNRNLKPWIATHHSAAQSEIDLTKAVVSADTERRLVRYVFPRKGAKTVIIKHADEPGVLRQLAQVLAQSQLNVLTALLRRGGQAPGTAELVAVCEPPEGHDPSQIHSRLTQLIDALPPRLRAHMTTNDGRAGTEVVHIPDMGSPRSRRPMLYLSDRFLSKSSSPIINKAISTILEKNGFIPLTGTSTPDNGQLTFFPGAGHIWSASAGIVPLLGERDWTNPSLTLALA